MLLNFLTLSYNMKHLCSTIVTSLSTVKTKLQNSYLLLLMTYNDYSTIVMHELIHSSLHSFATTKFKFEVVDSALRSFATTKFNSNSVTKINDIKTKFGHFANTSIIISMLSNSFLFQTFFCVFLFCCNTILNNSKR